MKMKDRVMELLEQGYSAVYTESVVYGEFHELDIREIHQTIKDAKSDETALQLGRKKRKQRATKQTIRSHNA